MFQYPLRWPDGWPRHGIMRQTGWTFQVEIAKAIDQLYSELRKLDAEHVVITTNLPTDITGRPNLRDSNASLSDPGVALYFARKSRPFVIAQDSYMTVKGNLRSIGLAIDALRKLERHGGKHLLDRAVEGFAALPPPDKPRASWREIMGLRGVELGGRELLELAEARYKFLARINHPDNGGTAQGMATLNVAIGEARKELAS